MNVIITLMEKPCQRFSTDTHAISHFDYMSYGVSIGRRGWLVKKDVLNTMSYNSLIKTLRGKRSY